MEVEAFVKKIEKAVEGTSMKLHRMTLHLNGEGQVCNAFAGVGLIHLIVAAPKEGAAEQETAD
jgi:hypothetical protein